MRKSLFFAFSFLMLFSFSSNAQIVKEKTTRAERRAKDRANRNVDNAIDDAVDDAFNKIGSIFKKKRKKSKKKEESESTSSSREDSPTRSESRSESNEMSEDEMAKKMKGMFGESPEIKDSYTFHTTVTMKGYTEKSNGKKKDEFILDWMFATDGSSFGMGTKDKHDALMIMDLATGAMININQKDKQAMVFNMDLSDVIADEKEEHDNNTTIHKTGRTKTILGYSCDEFESEDDEMKGTFWYTTQIKGFDFSRLPKKFNKGKKNPWDQLAQKGGLMLESKMTEKKKKGKTHHMNATKVSKTNKTFRMSDYKVMSLGDMMNGDH